MAQPAQITFNDPNNDFNVVDNSAASTTATLAGPNNSSPIGFDTPAVGAPGAQAQGLNSFGGQGTVLLDISGNDQVRVAPHDATFPGNPVAMTNPTYKKVTTVLQDSRVGLQIAWKNPA